MVEVNPLNSRTSCEFIDPKEPRGGDNSHGKPTFLVLPVPVETEEPLSSA